MFLPFEDSESIYPVERNLQNVEMVGIKNRYDYSSTPLDEQLERG